MAPVAAALMMKGLISQSKQMILFKLSLPVCTQQSTSCCLETTVARRATSTSIADSDVHNSDYFAPQDLSVKSSYNYVVWAVVGGIVGSIMLCTVIYLTRWCVNQRKPQQDILQKALSRSSQTCRRWLASLPPTTCNEIETYQMARIAQLSHAPVDQLATPVQGHLMPSTAPSGLVRLPEKAKTAAGRPLRNESEERERFTTLLRLEGHTLAGNHVNYIPEDDFRCFVDDLQRKAMTNSLRHQQSVLPRPTDTYLMSPPLTSPKPNDQWVIVRKQHAEELTRCKRWWQSKTGK
jgi:hypothetical protein